MSNGNADRPLQEDILVIDDTPGTLRLLVDILTTAGFRVRPANDGALALRSVRAQLPSLILLDVRMPEIDGYEICRRLKAEPATRSIPIIFLSALGEERDKIRAFEAGGVDYLTKPFHAAEVLARVNTHLALRRMQIDLERRNAELNDAREHLEERVRSRTAELQREIDEHRQTAAALRQSEQKFRAMAETVPDILFTGSPEGSVDYLSARFYEYTGVAPGAGDGNAWLDVLAPDDRQRVQQQVQQGVQRGEPFEVEFRARSRDGQYRWFVVRTRPIHDEQGRLVKWFGACTDIHDLKTTQETLQRFNEQLEQRVLERTALAEHRAGQLRLLAAELTQAEERERHRIARVLHDELQQLLVVARMRVALLRRHTQDAQIRGLSDQIDDLLNQAITESRSLTASLSPPVLYDRGLIGGLEWLTRQAQEEWGIAVDLSVAPEAEPAELDIRALLFQAARELLLNVMKHAQTNRVQVTLDRHEEWLRLVVADEGVGFDPAVAEHQGKPTGFGLFSIRERLELIGGKLLLQSTSGQGTRVQIEVPWRRIPPTAVPLRSPVETEAGGPQAKAPAPPGKVRVLLVDDHAVLRQGLAGLLREQATMDVVGEAGGGHEAVELAVATRPDVILMDVSMPDISGIEATRRITDMLPQTRVIGLSMHEAEDMATAMLKAGAVAYLRKDTQADALLSAILHHGAKTPHCQPVR